MSSLTTLYRRYTNRKMDAKTLKFWESALAKSGSTMADFEAFVAGSTDYTSRVIQLFKTKHIELLGVEPDARGSDAFMRACAGRLVDDAEVHEYVAGTPECQQKHRTLVTTVGGVAAEKHGRGLTAEEVDALVGKFQKDAAYGISELETDVENILNPSLPPASAPSAPAVSFLDIEAPEGCRDVLHGLQQATSSDVVDATTVARLVSELVKRCSSAALHVHLPATAPVTTSGVWEWLEAWEREAGRPMYVQEYLKYSGKDDMNDERVRAAVQLHRRVYEHARKLQEKYADQQLSEHDFVRLHIYAMDDPEFLQTMLEDVLRSEDYRSMMTQALVDMHRRLYDAAPDADSTAFMFSQALTEQLALNDERLRDLVVTFRKECDAQAARAHEVYLKVYGREPDADEVAQVLPLYRASHGGYDDVDARVVRQLMSGLEFHDVIKKKIKLHYWEAHGNEIGAAALYKVLDVCLASLGRVADMEQATDMVRQAIARAAGSAGSSS